METRDKLLRTGALAVLFALLVRLAGPWLSGLGVWELFVLTQTGRRIRPAADQVQTLPTEQQAQVLPAQAAALVQLQNHTAYQVDIPALLQQPVTGDRQVLILHTHGTESYLPREDYRESAPYRTADCDYNVVSVGRHLTQLLQQQGFAAEQDSTLYDLEDYAGAYALAREGTLQRLEGGTPLILDLHRDAAVDDQGRQVCLSVSTPRGSCAQLMLVVGTDEGGWEHPHWRENLALAVQLQALLEGLCPGLCRPIQLRSARYNQDLSPGALLVEVGSTGSTRQEALLGAEYLAQAIALLYR